MANELMEKKEDLLVSTLEEKGLGEVIKPLTKEIYLFDSYIAGTTHLEDQSVLDTVEEGDSLKLMREDNKFDAKAILIFTQENKKLGYVPEQDNLIFSRLMDAGKLLSAKIDSIELRGTFHRIRISIYLIDF